MKRFIALAAVALLSIAGLMAEARPTAQHGLVQHSLAQPDLHAPGIPNDMLNAKPPAPPPPLVCFKPDAVQGFSYRATANKLRVSIAENENYDVSFFVPCGGLASTDALTFDGVTGDQVCGTGVESVLFYSTEQGPKRCSIRDVKQQPPVAQMGR